MNICYQLISFLLSLTGLITNSGDLNNVESLSIQPSENVDNVEQLNPQKSKNVDNVERLSGQKKKCLVAGYGREALHYIPKDCTILIYSYLHSTIGNPFIPTKQINLDDKNGAFTSLYPTYLNTIIFCVKNNQNLYELQQWKIELGNFKKCGSMSLQGLSKHDVIQDILFREPNYLIISFNGNSLYFLRFKTCSKDLLQLSLENTKYFVKHEDSNDGIKNKNIFDYNQPKMILWKNKLIIIKYKSISRSEWQTKGKVTIQQWNLQLTPSCSYTTSITNPEKCIQLYKTVFLKQVYRSNIYRHPFKRPFFTITSGKKNLPNDIIPITSQDEEGDRLFCHNLESFSKRYDHKKCCAKGYSDNRKKLITVVPLNEYLIFKHEHKPWTCLYNVLNNEWHHVLMKKNYTYTSNLSCLFPVKEDIFLLATEEHYRDTITIYIMKWQQLNKPINTFLKVLTNKYNNNLSSKNNIFIEQFTNWVWRQYDKKNNDQDDLNSLKNEVEILMGNDDDGGYRKDIIKNEIGLKEEQLQKKHKEALIYACNYEIAAKRKLTFIGKKEIQDNIELLSYTGAYLIGIEKSDYENATTYLIPISLDK